jgi:drug/metabolite transporter (DMT)-like permease
MLWFLLALVGAFFDATYYALTKNFLKNIPDNILASGALAIAAIELLSLSLIVGVPPIGDQLWSAVIITTILNIAGLWLYYQALRTSELSHVFPLFSLTPLFLVISSWFILHESPTVMGLIGLCSVVTGVYLINLKGKSDLLEPIKSVAAHKGSLFIILAAILYSVSSSYDKVVVLESDAFFGIGIAYGLMALFYLGLSIKNERNILIVTYKKSWLKLLLLGTILSLIGVAINLALTLELATYVIAVKRLSIVFSLVYGMFLFKEKINQYRLAGIFFATVGAIIIALS